MQKKSVIKIEPRLLKGFQDLLPKEAVVFDQLIEAIKKSFEKFGFAPLKTPALEYADILLGKYGAEGDKLMYRFVDQGNRAVAMRYDHTVPLARLIGQNQQQKFPFKRYVIAPVWRADKPQKGRLRELYQCDIDTVGSKDPKADAEIIAVIDELFTDLGIKKFGLLINHRGLLNVMVQKAGLAENQIPGIFHAIDKFPKYGEQNFIKDAAKLGLNNDQIKQLLTFISFSGKPSVTLTKLSKQLSAVEQGKQVLQELSDIFEHAASLGVSEKNVRLDLKIVRGLDYYTGMVLETVLEELPLYGSVVGGGRYDNLIGMFSGRQIPAVGTSFGLSRLFAALQELKLAPQYKNPARVLCAFMDPEGEKMAENMAHDLRAHDINCQVYLGKQKRLSGQLKYAADKEIPLVAWQGEEERAKKKIAIKNLATKKQITVSFNRLVESVLKILDR